MICKFEKSIFEKDSFCTYLYKAQTLSVPCDAVKSKVDENVVTFIAIGKNLPKFKFCNFELNGEFKESEKYGLRFEVKEYKVIKPTKELNVLFYMCSSLCSSIDFDSAYKIYKYFGNESINIVENSPEKLMDIFDIPIEKLKEIILANKLLKVKKELVGLIEIYGLNENDAEKLTELLGVKAFDIVNENPYKLSELKGITFDKVDKIALNKGITLDNKFRIRSGMFKVLNDLSRTGTCSVESDTLIKKATEFLKINENLVTDAVDVMISRKDLIKYNGLIYRKVNFNVEESICVNLVNKFINYKNEKLNNVEETLLSITSTLSKTQNEAVLEAFSNNISIITGGAGTGKTTTIKSIIDVWKCITNKEVLLLAPTGLASKRMTDATNVEAFTIHKALDYRGEDIFGNKSILVDYELIIIDEMSMIDNFIFSEFMKKVKAGTKVVLCGDVDQLPSIGVGNVLDELIKSKKINVTYLDKVYRQGEESLILKNANLVNKGENTLEFGFDFSFEAKGSIEEISESVCTSYLNEISKKSIMDVQILVPYKNYTDIGTKILNNKIRDKVNPKSEYKQEVVYMKKVYRTGDKIIQTKNTKDLVNGDIGLIDDIYSIDNKVVIKTTFNGDRTILLEYNDLENIELAYAITIHKSQGCEYKTVLLPISMAFKNMLSKNIYYTAITRAKEEVHFIGDTKALNYAIKHSQKVERNSGIASLLGEITRSDDNIENKKIA